MLILGLEWITEDDIYSLSHLVYSFLCYAEENMELFQENRRKNTFHFKIIGLILQWLDFLNLGWFMLKNLKSLTAKKKKHFINAFDNSILYFAGLFSSSGTSWIALALEQEIVQKFGD